MHAKSLSRVQLIATPRTVACWAPLSMGFSRQEDCSGLTFPPPGDLPHPRIEFTSLIRSLALAGGFFTASATWEVPFNEYMNEILEKTSLYNLSLRRKTFISGFYTLFFFLIACLSIWLCWVLAEALGMFSCDVQILSCGMWDLDP